MKKIKRMLGGLLSIALAVSVLGGCQTIVTEHKQETQQMAGTEKEIIVTDQAGRQVKLPGKAKKLVSSYYISTAILVALGCADDLQGIEMKAETRELYKLAAPDFLDLPAVGSGKGINVEETAALAPDLVILPARLLESAAFLEELGIPVLVVNPESQEDFEACVSLLAKVTGTDERGEELLAYYHEKMDEVKNLTKDLARPKVYMAAGSDYLSTCTSQMYQNELIQMAGGENVSAGLSDGYWQAVSAEDILNWNPDYFFAVNYAEYSLDDIRGDMALARVKAVQDEKIMLFPSKIEAWDSPAPSSVLGVLWLTNQLHPEVYTKEQYLKEVQYFYQKFFGISVTEEQLEV